MKITKQKAENKLDQMSTKANVVSITQMTTGPMQVWKDGRLEYANFVVYKDGGLTYARGSAFRSTANPDIMPNAIWYAGKGQLLIEEKDENYQFFSKKHRAPKDHSMIIAFRYAKKLIMIVADSNFTERVRYFEIENSSAGVALCLSTLWGIVNHRDPAAAGILQQGLGHVKDPFGKD